MRDLNFFEPYIVKREFKFNKMFFVYLVILAGLLFILGSGIYNQILISGLKTEVNNLQAIAEDPKTVNKVNEIMAKETEVITFREEVSKIQQVDETINAKEIIGEDLLIKITSKLPEGMFLTSISVQDIEINLLGICKDRWAVAEFAKGLEVIDNVDSIYISNISQVDEYYNFNINITIKDVMVDGENQEEKIEG